jgi:DNA-binding GntR family transcriptional regulator
MTAEHASRLDPGRTSPHKPAEETDAYELIRAAIVENRYAPGQRLIEQRIAEEYGLSRTPVREALRRLEAEGLIVAQKNRGARVRPMSATELVDLYGLRIRLESYAAELAAERATDEEIEALGRAVDEFSAVRHSLDGHANVKGVRRLNVANQAFHDQLVAAAKHERLAAMLRRTVDIPLVFRAFSMFGADEIERSDLFHRLIHDAVRRRDGARAGRLMGEHIQHGLDAARDAIEADSDGDGPVGSSGRPEPAS